MHDVALKLNTKKELNSWDTLLSSLNIMLYMRRYWTTEKDRIKRGLKPRLWFALFQCLKMVFVAHGVLFGLEVNHLIT